MANFDLAPLTIDEMEEMSDEQIKAHEDEMVFLAKMKEDEAREPVAE